MPRNKRIYSKTQVYHVMIRGVNKQDIFLDNTDNVVFISLLKKVKEKYNFDIYAYVLMKNHVHIELKDNEDNISKIIHKLSTSYAMYFNKKYERVGHLFQDRFKSNPVEDDVYLINLVIYIHQNPEKAKIQLTDKYKWSSYQDYIKNKNDLVDINFILNILNEDRKIAIEQFKKIHKTIFNLVKSEEILKYEIKTKLEDEELFLVIENILGKETMRNLSKCKVKEIQNEIEKLMEIKGATFSRIAKLINIRRKNFNKNKGVSQDGQK